MQKLVIGTEELTIETILELYNNVGWTVYSKKSDDLFEAIQNSTYVVTRWDKDTIIGLARCISDDVSINYLQDILVHTEYQKQGIGRILLENCLERFKHVRTHLLLTDDEERQRLFYESLGYKNTKDLEKIKLNCYVKMNNIELL